MDDNDPAKEWGLPDWRDASSYRNSFGDPSEWSFARWRWEFLRRREDYREAFASLAATASERIFFQDCFTKNGKTMEKQMAQGKLISVVGQRGFAFSVAENLGLLSKFGMFFLPNPKFSDQPEQSLLLAAPYVASKYAEDGTPLYVVTWQFNLMRPLAEQLEDCESQLKAIKERLPGAIWEEKHHVQNWHEYLQALDARENDVSYAQMVGPAFPNRKTRDAITGLVNQAKGVRDNF